MFHKFQDQGGINAALSLFPVSSGFWLGVLKLIKMHTFKIWIEDLSESVQNDMESVNTETLLGWMEAFVRLMDFYLFSKNQGLIV